MQVNNTVAEVGEMPSLKLEVQDMSFKARVTNYTFPSLGAARRWPVAVRRVGGDRRVGY